MLNNQMVAIGKNVGDSSDNQATVEKHSNMFQLFH